MFTLLPWLLVALANPDCPAIEQLQAGATKGQLTDEAVQCLVERRGTEPNLEQRAKISQLLIADSHGKGQTIAWSSHVVWHLENVDADDADLAYQFGLHLYKRGASDEAERWARHALEHGYAWNNEEAGPVKRLNTHALIARAVQQGHLAMLQTSEPSDMAIRASVGRVQLAAVKWLASASVAERDGSEAMALCVETGWDKARCEERASAMK